MKKVLIAVDYHPASEKVTLEGHRLAQLTKAEVCLIHVMDDAGYYGAQYPTFLGYEGYPAMAPDLNLAIEMQNIAKDFLEQAAKHLDDPSVKTHLAEGDVPKSLLSYAKEWGADVIVMGTHSHSVLEKLIMGTVAEKVLEKTEIPLFLVPVKK